MITIEDQKRIKDFYELIDAIGNYTQVLDSYFSLKRDSAIAFYGGVFEMLEQFDAEDLDRIEIYTKNHDKMCLNDAEKEVYIDAINYAKSDCLSKKKKYCCYLKIDYYNTQLIYNTKIETNIIIEAISQEYLKMSEEAYKDYICCTAVNIFENQANLVNLFELTGGFEIPEFTYEEIGNAENR